METKMTPLTEKNECWHCENKKPVPGNCHIRCGKPDLEMTGNQRGIDRGRFDYPMCFDPMWKTKKCENFEPKENLLD